MDRSKNSKLRIIVCSALLVCGLALCSCSNNTKTYDVSEESSERQAVFIINESEDYIEIDTEEAERTEEPEETKETETRETETTEETDETEEAKETNSITLYVTDIVNIRKSPSIESEIIAKTSSGDAISFIEDYDDEWAVIIYDEQKCFIAKRYLTDDPDWRNHLLSKNGYKNQEAIALNKSWRFADFSEINSGNAVMYLAPSDRKDIIIGVNAGHGTDGGTSAKTWCHPDKTEKVTSGTTAAGETKAAAVSSGMRFKDGTPEKTVTLKEAQLLKDILLSKGYDVLMIRDGEDVQLDNVARAVICNNTADCHIAIHWDGDGLDYDKGCFYMSVPDGIKNLDTVAAVWHNSENLGKCLIDGLREKGCKIRGEGSMDMDLTQTAFSTVPSVDIELGNQCSLHDEKSLKSIALGLANGIESYFMENMPAD